MSHGGLRRVVPLVLGLGLALAGESARACSCAVYDSSPSRERCEGALRVFAGTIAGYDWPLGHELAGSAQVRLAVDAVWRGDVPSEVVTSTGLGCCACGISPPPGTRFLVCDDEVGDAPPAFSTCSHPRFEPDAERFLDDLGAGRPPARGPAFRAPEVRDALQRHRLLALPVGATLLGALLGRLVGRLRPRATTRRSAARTLGLVLLLGGALVLARLVLRAALPDSWERVLWVMDGVPAIAALVGLALGYRGQRDPGRHGGAGRGFVLACVGVVVVLTAGFARLHAPIQPSDAVACSQERARVYVKTLPEPVKFDEEDDREARDARLEAYGEALRDAAGRAPFACTDWGLSRMRVDPSGPCVLFDDGRGGTYRLCVGDERLRFSAEGPG